MDWLTNLVDPRRRLSNWLLLHHPRIWRLRPLEGLAVSTVIWLVGLVGASVLRRAVTDDPVNGRDASDALSAILGTCSFAAWIWWSFQRTGYPCSALPWRQRLRGLLWIDLGFWLVFLLPMPSLKPLVMGESPSPADVAIAAAALVGGWVLLTGAAFALVALGGWLSRKDPERLFRWFRWDVLLGPALRDAGRLYETDLAARHPVMWHLRLHRLLGILPILAAVQLLLAAIGRLADNVLAAILCVCFSLVFLFLRAVTQTYAPVPQAFAPDFRWVFLHAVATSALIVPGLFLAQSLGLFKPLPPLDGRSLALLLWSATWVFVLVGYFLDGRAETFVGCATAAFAFGLAAAFPFDAVQVVMSVLWGGCCLYLAMRRFHSRQLRREAGMALLVMSAAAGVFVALALPDVHPGPAWQLVLFDAAVLLLARLGPLEVLRRRRVIPAPT